MQPDSNGDVAVAPPAPDADAETTAFLDRYLPVPPPDDIPMQGPHIASDSDLERFAALPASQRCLTDTLKGVLLETALTGVVRYNWSLIRPLAESLMEKVSSLGRRREWRAHSRCSLQQPPILPRCGPASTDTSSSASAVANARSLHPQGCPCTQAAARLRSSTQLSVLRKPQPRRAPSSSARGERRVRPGVRST